MWGKCYVTFSFRRTKGMPNQYYFEIKVAGIPVIYLAYLVLQIFWLKTFPCKKKLLKGENLGTP